MIALILVDCNFQHFRKNYRPEFSFAACCLCKDCLKGIETAFSVRISHILHIHTDTQSHIH